jgi:YCII-related domain-containing protein
VVTADEPDGGPPAPMTKTISDVWRRAKRRCERTLPTMKYVCLVYLEESKLRAVPDHKCQECGEGFRKDGLLVAAEALQRPRSARTWRVRDGKIVTIDGPFTETKEVLAGS